MVLASLAACGRDSTGADGAASVVPIAGHGVADTIGAVIAQPLVLEVRGPNGRPRPGAVVRFDVPRDGPWVVLVPAGTGSLEDTGEAIADARGQVTVQVRLGNRAGAVRVGVSVPELGVDTVVPYTIRPGLPTRVVVLPADTMVYAGASYTLRAGLADRSGNVHPDPVSYEARSAGITVSAAGTVTGAAVGRARVAVRALNWQDSAFVSVVPTGTLAVRDLGVFADDTLWIATVGLDGSGYRRRASLGPRASNSAPTGLFRVEWVPGGDQLVYGVGPRLFTVGPGADAVPRRLTAEGGALQTESDPAVSPDGAWVYFVGSEEPSRSALWRIRPDGTALERLPSSPAEPRLVQAPSPSPDGTRLAYVARNESYGDYFLHVRNVATGSAARIAGGQAAAPRWSPRGDLIAYSESASYGGYSGPLRVVRPDGSGNRVVTPGSYDPGADWSPDGRYLLARRATGAYVLEIIDVETGERLPLYYRPLWYGATWRR
jgi:hypothetical protein